MNPLFDTEKFWESVDTTMEQYPRWRKGQAVFNVMCDLYPEAAEQWRASSIDPFHNDKNVPDFVVACRNFVSNEGKTS